MERRDYQNISEFIREAIREKLQKETQLHPEEIQRIMNIRERERKGEQDWLTKEEVLEELDKEESEIRELRKTADAKEEYEKLGRKVQERFEDKEITKEEVEDAIEQAREQQ